MWTLTDAFRWMREGTDLFLRLAAALDEAGAAADSLLPGWSRKHVVAHVSANAEALENLVRWAATGMPTPMYPSPTHRADRIDSGGREPHERLKEWLARSARSLEHSIGRLDETQWTVQVRTAAGRMVSATHIPWLRAREVWVHAVDLGLGVGFEDLPSVFLMALADDAVDKRRETPGQTLMLDATDVAARWRLPGTTDPVTVTGSLADIVAYLTGRAHAARTAKGEPAPPLPAWL